MTKTDEELIEQLENTIGWLAALDYPGVGTAMAACREASDTLALRSSTSPQAQSDHSSAAVRVLERVDSGEIDLREIASAMGEKWDQDFPRALLELAVAPPASAQAVTEEPTASTWSRFSLFDDGLGVDPNGPYVLYDEAVTVTDAMVERARTAHAAIFRDILQERTIDALAPERQEANDNRMMRAALVAALHPGREERE